MDKSFNEISDLVNAESTLPINWNASGKMSLSKCAGSEENMIGFQDGDNSCDWTPSSFEKQFANIDSGKTPKRMVFCSMPDLSMNNDLLPPPKGGPRRIAGSVASTTALGGRTTPSSSSGGNKYTLKEYEQQLDKLQKENFNLKLRIWHLEEEYRRKGGVTEDVEKRELEGQISELSVKLEEKERMIKELLDVLNQLKANAHRQLLELRREHETEMETVGRKFTERVTTLEDLLHSANEQVQSLQNENEQLSKLVSSDNRNPSAGFESDSDVSLMSQRDRQIFDLKARIAMLERVQQSSSSLVPQVDEQDSRLKQNTSASGFDSGTLKYDELEMDELKRELADKDTIIRKMQLEIQEMDEFISRIRCGVEDAERRIAELESGNREKEEYISTLESNIEEKNQVIARLDTENTRYKTRMETIVHGQRTQTNNSDDEKVRQLEAELNNERANSLKSAKIIQGLLKQITNERKNRDRSRDTGTVVQTGPSLYHTPQADVSKGDFGDDQGIDYSATVIAWLNETAGVHIRQQDDLFRRQLAELQTTRETLYDRLKRVADNLEEYGKRLAVGVDGQHVLSALSSDLTVLRQDLQESLVNATYSIVAALASGGRSKAEISSLIADPRAVDAGNEISFNDSRQVQGMSEQPYASDVNLSNISRLSTGEVLGNGGHVVAQPRLPQLHKSAQTDPVTPVNTSMAPTASSGTGTGPGTATGPDTGSIDDLHRRCAELSQQYDHLQHRFKQACSLKDKYERYAKVAKAKYRELLKSPLIGNVEGGIDELLTGYKQVDELVERVVRQLEENNRILGEKFEDHERHDKKLKEAVKREAAKAKELKRRLEKGGKVEKEQ